MTNYSESSIIYISQQNGSDLCSGGSPVFEEGNRGPLKTLKRAMELVSGIRNGGLFQPLSLCFTEDYFIDEELSVCAEKQSSIYSRSAELRDITFESLPGKRVRLIGGKKLTGFKKDKLDGIDCVSLDVGSIGCDLTSLCKEDRYLPAARYPKNGTLRALDTENNTLDNGHVFGSRWITADKDDLKDIDDIENAGVTFFHWWVDEHTSVANYDRETGRLDFNDRSQYTMIADYSGKASHADTYYYLENVRKGFGEKNSWYFDKRSGKLYYVPDENDDPENIVLYAPRVKRIASVVGSEEHKVSGIRFKNIDFFCSDGAWNWTGSTEMFPEKESYACCGQSHFIGISSLYFDHAEMCSVENCRFYGLGFHAVEVGKGCDTVRIEGCEFFQNGGSAIKIEGRTENGPECDSTRNVIVRNNFIHENGRYYKASCGIILMHASHCEISDNEICDQDYSGISVGWVWGYHPSTTRCNLIRRNHIHHIGEGELSDLGAIYTLGRQDGTIVEDNLIHDISSKFYGAHAIHSDEGSSFILWESNIVYGSKQNCFHLHFGTGNAVRRNAFGFADQALIRTSRYEGTTSIIFEDNDFITEEAPVFHFENNCGIVINGNNGSVASHDNRLWDVKRNGAPMMSCAYGEITELPEWQKLYDTEQRSTVGRPSDIETEGRTLKKKK